MTRLTLLSRGYCSLCEKMETALEAFQGRFSSPFTVEVVDIDRHPALEAVWGDKVPVLMRDGQEICHYVLDEAALARALG